MKTETEIIDGITYTNKYFCCFEGTPEEQAKEIKRRMDLVNKFEELGLFDDIIILKLIQIFKEFGVLGR